jgi:hypothetical protein
VNVTGNIGNFPKKTAGDKPVVFHWQQLEKVIFVISVDHEITKRNPSTFVKY